MKEALVGISLLAAVMWPLAGSADDWSQMRGNNKFDGYASMPLPDDLGVKWSAPIPGGTSPVVASGRVFLCGSDMLSAYYASSGAPAWSVLIPDLRTDRPAVGKGKIYVASLNGGFQAYDLGSGELEWFNEPREVNGVSHEVFMPNPESVIYFATMMISNQNVEGRMFLQSEDGNYPCMPTRCDWRIEGGTFFIWECEEFMRGSRHVVLNSAIFNASKIVNYGPSPSCLYYSPCGTYVSYMRFDGTLITNQPTYGAQVGGGTPCDIDMGGPILTSGSYFLCLATGGRLAQRDMYGVFQWVSIPLGGIDRNSVAEGNGTIAVLDRLNRRLIALNSSGQVKQWGTIYLSSDLSCTPTSDVTITNNAILIGDSDGYVRVFDPDTLVEKQAIKVPGGGITGEIAVTDTGVFVVAGNYLSCLGVNLTGCRVSSYGYPEKGHQAIGPFGVNTLSGNMVFTVQDLSIPFAGLSINVLRTYNSQRAEPIGIWGAYSGTPYESALGAGWTHSLQLAMRPQFDVATGATVYVEERGDGREPVYTPKSGSDDLDSPAGIDDKLGLVDTPYVLNTGSVGKGVTAKRKDGVTKEYDPDGNLIRIRDPNGTRLEFTYVSATVFSIMASGMRLTSIMYSATWNTDSYGTTTAEYSATVYLDYQMGTALLTKVSYPHPSGAGFIETNYGYTDGLLSSVTGPDGIYNAQYQYNYKHQMSGKNDPRAPVGEKNIAITYDNDGRVSEVLDSGNKIVTTFTYLTSFSGSVETVVGQDIGEGGWALTSYLYDSCKLLKEVHDGAGGITKYGYDDNLNRVWMTDPNGNSTSWFYDSRSNLLGVVDALGGVATYEYEPVFNRMTKKTDQNGNETIYTYDGTGNMTATVQRLKNNPPLGDVQTDYITVYENDGRGLPVHVRDPEGNETFHYYDGTGSLTGTARRLKTGGSSFTDLNTAYEYDALGKRTAQVDPAGIRTEYAYDLENRLIGVKYGIVSGNPPLSEMNYAYFDSNNLVKSEADNAGRHTDYTCTDRDMVETAKDSLGFETKYEYDPMGNRTKMTDPKNNITEYSYDLVSRLKKVKDALGNVSSYFYDLAGNLKQVNDPNGNSTRYQYDALNRQTEIYYPNDKYTIFLYDAAGNRTSKEDWDFTTSYFYDSLNRLRRISYEGFVPTPPVAISYDGASRKTEVNTKVDGQAYSVYYTYDSLSRPVQEAIYEGGSVLAMKYMEYDEAGRRTKLKVEPSTGASSSHTIKYLFDALGRATEVESGSNKTEYEYDSGCTCGSRSRPVKISYPNGLSCQMKYDLDERLLSLRNARVSSNAALSYFTYKYDEVGNRTSMNDITGKYDYTYDAIYRLTSMKHPVWPDQSYAYDPAGNRIWMSDEYGGSSTYLYDSSNELQTVKWGGNKSDYIWDGSGNLYEEYAKISGKYFDHIYEYNADSRLTYAELPDGTAIIYGYDYDGQRVKEVRDGKATWFLYDGLDVVMELGDDKKPLTLYVPGVSRTRLDLPTPLTEYYLHDGLGSVVQMTDTHGNITQEYHYEPFGWGYQRHDPFNRNRFVGLQTDDLTDLIYMNARWYDPRVGRFISRDPIEGNTMKENNLYVYVLNNPLNNTDPTGMIMYFPDPDPWQELLNRLGVGGPGQVEEATKEAVRETANQAAEKAKEVAKKVASTSKCCVSTIIPLKVLEKATGRVVLPKLAASAIVSSGVITGLEAMGAVGNVFLLWEGYRVIIKCTGK